MKCVFRLIVVIGVLFFSLWFLNNITNALYVSWLYSFANFEGAATGEIVESEYTSRRRGSTYKIRYIYFVGDEAYFSDTINFKPNNTDTAYKTHKEYPVGKSVEVYYDLRNPNYATLTKDEPTGFLWFQAISILLGSAAISFVAYSYAKKYT